jgi:hypothetical protein
LTGFGSPLKFDIAMGTREYSLLSLHKRANLLWNKGRFLSSAHGKTHSYSLYSFDDFYAEIVISHKGGGIIEDVIPFKQGFRFDKYPLND